MKGRVADIAAAVLPSMLARDTAVQISEVGSASHPRFPSSAKDTAQRH